MKINWINEHGTFWNGGIRYIFEMTRRLAKNHEVSLTVQGISEKNEKMFSDANVQVLDLETTTPNTLKYWLFYPYYLVKHAMMLMKAQMIYQFDVWISSSPTTHIQCMMAGIKPIIVVFEINPWLYDPAFRKGLSPIKRLIVNLGSWLATNLERAAYNNAKHIISQSKFIQSEIKRVYGLDSTVVYAGVDTDLFKPTHNAELEEKYKNKQIVLHVASHLTKQKGTDYAVEAMGIVNQEFPDALLLIVNSNNETDRQYELFDLANQCGAYIRFVTSVKDTDLPVYYTMAKCLLNPSLDENVHLPVFEASVCETPSVGFIGQAESEDIVSGHTGWLALNMGKADINLAKYVVSILRYPKVGIAMGQHARRFIIDRFNWDKSVEKYKEILNDSSL